MNCFVNCTTLSRCSLLLMQRNSRTGVLLRVTQTPQNHESLGFILSPVLSVNWHNKIIKALALYWPSASLRIRRTRTRGQLQTGQIWAGEWARLRSELAFLSNALANWITVTSIMKRSQWEKEKVQCSFPSSFSYYDNLVVFAQGGESLWTAHIIVSCQIQFRTVFLFSLITLL